MLKNRCIQNKLLEETFILLIVDKTPNLNGYGVAKICRERGLDIGYTTLFYLMNKMVEEELLLHGIVEGFTISRIGKRKLLSNRCLLRQLIP
jgi:hypothetical protein